MSTQLLHVTPGSLCGYQDPLMNRTQSLPSGGYQPNPGGK